MITTFFAFVLVLGFLVFVHEFGHFIVAKLVGVRVHVFSIGFGPKIIGREWRGTEYRLSWLPLGGYVKMAGENPMEETSGAPDEFLSRTVWERIAIIFAGPAMNLIWAVIFIAVIYYAGVDSPAFLKETPRVGWVEPASPAEKARVQVGDVIREVGGQEVATWEDVYSAAAQHPDSVRFLLDRNGQPVPVLFIAEGDSLQYRLWGIEPFLAATVSRTIPDFPAAKAGIRPGDRIIAVDGDSIRSFYDLTRVIHDKAEQKIAVTVLREGEPLTFELTPRRDEQTGRGLIGIYPEQKMEKVRFGVWASLKRSVETNIQVAGFIGGYLKQVISGEVSGKEIGGPIMIAQVAGDAARSGWLDVVWLMGVLSLQLGLLNLLPIPILDGGHLLLFTLEAITGKPLSLRNREIAQMIGLFILISIMVYAFFNDIARLFS